MTEALPSPAMPVPFGPDPKPGNLRWLVVIITAAMLVRTGFVLAFGETLSLQTSGYDDYAVNLLDGRGFTRFDDRPADSDLPPLYPFFLAGVYTLFGRGAIPVALVQTALEGLTIVLIYRIGRRVGGGAVGRLSAAFYAAYPYLVFQNLTVNDTGLFILLLAASVWLSYRVHDTRGSRWALALGAAIGFAALTKPLILLLWPVLIVWWLRRLGRRDALRLGLAGTLTTMAAIAPWVIRNSLLNGEPAFISTNGGSNLHQGNNACVVDYLRQGWDAQWVDCLATAPPGLGDTALDRWHREQALTYLWENPGEWPRLFGTKLLTLWNPAITPARLPPGAAASDDPVTLYNTPAFEAARSVHLVYFGSMLLLGAYGMVPAWRARMNVEPLVGVIVAITVAYAIFHPSTRYRSPADPFLFVFSAVAVEKLWGWLSVRRHPTDAA